MLICTNKGCAHTESRVGVVLRPSHAGPAEESVGASEEERGQCAEHRERDEDRIEAAPAAIEGEGQ